MRIIFSGSLNCVEKITELIHTINNIIQYKSMAYVAYNVIMKDNNC